MAKKPKCSGCNGKGLLPWCHLCYKTGYEHTRESFEREVRPILVEKERIANMSQIERIEYDRMKDVFRNKYLQNAKDLKKMLSAALRDRKLLTGKAALDAIIMDIVSESIAQIHLEIDDEELTEIAPVIARFNELVTTPDYSHTDWAPGEREKFLEDQKNKLQ